MASTGSESPARGAADRLVHLQSCIVNPVSCLRERAAEGDRIVAEAPPTSAGLLPPIRRSDCGADPREGGVLRTPPNTRLRAPVPERRPYCADGKISVKRSRQIAAIRHAPDFELPACPELDPFSLSPAGDARRGVPWSPAGDQGCRPPQSRAAVRVREPIPIASSWPAQSGNLSRGVSRNEPMLLIQ